MSRLTADELAERLRGFAGADVEIVRERLKQYFRGPINFAEVRGMGVFISFRWRARGEDERGAASSIPTQFVSDSCLEYSIELGTYYHASAHNEQLILTAPLGDGEVITFFSPGGDKLDPRQVLGLELPK